MMWRTGNVIGAVPYMIEVAARIASQSENRAHTCSRLPLHLPYFARDVRYMSSTDKLLAVYYFMPLSDRRERY